MATPLELLHTGVAMLALVFAATILFTSYRTYSRSRSDTHRNAFLGFVCLTSGLLVEEVLLRFSGIDLLTVHTLESLLFLLGFFFLYLSLR